ncbi:MAG TPA: S-methyl-5'-thioadenosine phosphorylase [Acidimicrobiia bacterium]|jgi:5'-methylthioadenosine phosphorylase|nr:S-methyl-5'-thioadenosine phosphorylase [Acidimicrobiia bacterium]
MPAADIGVFGGSGFYTFLDDAETVRVETPWGAPSAPVTVARVAGVDVAFLPRHGVHHELPAHRVDYRANVAAMRALGVRAVLAPFAAGSLRPDLRPGDLVVVDQLVDRTQGREDTYHDHFADGPEHVSLADPYDHDLRQVLLRAARTEGATAHDGGTVVVINGPRFSTRAESRWFARMGWDLVNMTQYPEAALAREAGIAYAGLALVTDYDTGLIGDDGVAPVTQDQVFAMFEANLERLRRVLVRAASVLATRSAAPPTPRLLPTPTPAR